MTPGEYLRACRQAARKSRCQIAIEARIHIGLVNDYEAGRLDVPREWRATLCAAAKADPSVLASLCAGRSPTSRLIDETREPS